MIGFRDVLETDRERLRTWRNLPEIAQYMYSDHEIGEDEHNRWFDQAMADSTRRYWIVTADEKPVGLVNIYDIDVPNSRAKWGLYVIDPRAQLRGAGAYAEFMVLEYVFRDLSLHKLACEVLEINERTLAMHERFGFTLDGWLRDEILKGGEFINVAILSILFDEWKALEPRMRAMLRL